MAVRGPERGGPQQPAPSTTPPSPSAQRDAALAQTMVRGGYAGSPAEAPRVVRSLLASLTKAGVRVPRGGTDSTKLESALSDFQGRAGLSLSGQLDEATQRALQDQGHLTPELAVGRTAPSTAPPSEAAQFDRAPAPKRDLPTAPDAAVAGAPNKSALGVETQQTSARVEWATPKTDAELQSLTQRLARAGFAGRQKGAAQLKEGLQKFQAQEGLPKTGVLDEKTAKALVEKGLLAREKAPASRKAVVGRAAASTDGSEEGDVADEEGGAMVGGPAVRGDDDRADRWGPRPGQSLRRGGKPAGGGAAEDAELALKAAQRNVERDHLEGILMPPFPLRHERPDVAKLGVVDVEPSLLNRAESAAHADEEGGGEEGDDNADDDSADDDSADDDSADDDSADEPAGPAEQSIDVDDQHYRVPSLWFQIEVGLRALRRDDGGQGAATYAWDFTLYAPGVYANDVTAKALLHLVVTKAGAFDKVWEDARFALNTRLLERERTRGRVSEQDLLQALRRARVR